MADKYVIFKIGDWLEEWKEHEDTPEEDHPLTNLQRKRLDGFVIRKSDVFAAGTLNAYGDQVLAAAEIIGPDHERYDELIRLADKAKEVAYEAEQYQDKKIPD